MTTGRIALLTLAAACLGLIGPSRSAPGRDDKPAEKSEPVKSIDHGTAPTAARTDVGSKAV